MSMHGVQSIEQSAGSGTTSPDFGPIHELASARSANAVIKEFCARNRVEYRVRLRDSNSGGTVSIHGHPPDIHI